jgi:antitoxin (DNA-binding transcriptional repressor) of toxin-antitoxin stability system
VEAYLFGLVLVALLKAKRQFMSIVTIEEAQAKLPQLIAHLAEGEELLITQNQQPIARLQAHQKPNRKPRMAGNCKGMLTIVADDDEHLKDFEEFME